MTDQILVGPAFCPSCGDYVLLCENCSNDHGTITKTQLAELAQTHLGGLEQQHRDLLDVLLRSHEHETHRLAREDYLNNNGANWRSLHERRVTELFLRERFGLPEHTFGECCEPSEDPAADMAAIAITDLGVDAKAADKVRELDS